MANLLARRSSDNIQRQVKELAAKGGEADPNGRQQRIPVSSVRPNPNQPRKNVDPGKIAALAENIRKVGLINPITVVWLAEGEYELRAGQRRLLAHEHLGETTILARVFLKSDPAVAIAENLMREDLDVVETALAFRSLMEQLGITDQTAVADLVGMERSRISRFLGVLRMPQDILDEYQDMADQISAARLFEVASAGTEDRQRQLWHLAKAGLTERELRDAKRSDAPIEVVTKQPSRESVAGDREARPMKPGKQVLGIIDRLSATMDDWESRQTQMDEDHRTRLESLRDQIDRLLKS
ncbi:ParB/RepB/Spo0J family partition protein (plasmid) [Skermanella mucosa]|uniref:ParB/RepB/Spo0J family partition protein n=1 Tax=Skermanella mucosa TaxID=1789672 RepID=UPI00192B5C75|nr:ParB/RepB/Spo0J family partition protein [Skermanella mucosa]UEM24831.1 ParB/RepB/Spo0J family partition protein [Skermanella mucosa]